MNGTERSKFARPVVAGAALGAVGLLAWLLGAFLDPAQAFFSWLVAYVFAVTTVVCALLMVMIGNLTAATWFVVLRRLMTAVGATLPLFALLWIPLLVGAGYLYPWTHPATFSGHEAELLAHKRAYLNLDFWTVRAVFYFAFWSVLALLLRRWSLRQDEHPDPELTRRQRTLSAAAVFPLGLAFTFAIFDWVMSLTPEWESSIFGAYLFAGGMLGGLATLAIALLLAERAGRFPVRVAEGNVHALGKLLFAFVIFWAYMAYSQGFLIWIADLPAEVTWYAARTRGSWAGVGILLICGHFLVPFFLLLSWRWKHKLAFVAGVGAWLLGMHYVDVYWMVLPVLHPEGVLPHWLDLAALLAVGGSVVAYGSWLQRGHATVPRGDPELERSLAYVST